MPRNSLGDISRAATISRLSTCNSGSRSSRNSKKCTLSRRPSQRPQASPTATSGYAPASPISSASSRRAATSGVSPRAEQCRRGSSTRSDTTSAPSVAPDRRRQPQAPPRAAGAAVATRCGQAGNRGGMLSARQRREAWNVELAQGLTWTDQPLLPLPVRGTAFRRHRVSGCCPSYIL